MPASRCRGFTPWRGVATNDFPSDDSRMHRRSSVRATDAAVRLNTQGTQRHREHNSAPAVPPRHVRASGLCRLTSEPLPLRLLFPPRDRGWRIAPMRQTCALTARQSCGRARPRAGAAVHAAPPTPTNRGRSAGLIPASSCAGATAWRRIRVAGRVPVFQTSAQTGFRRRVAARGHGSTITANPI